MFVWLVICLLFGGLMHAALRTAFNYKWVKLLAAPGVGLRKLAMTVAALVTGATVTQVNIYRTSERDIGFTAEGVAGVSKVLVPLAPLFACALALRAVNAMLGTPLGLDFSPPVILSLDTGGAMGFTRRLLALMVELVRQSSGADWGDPKLYVLLAFIFSLSLGAGVPFDKFRESLLGVAVLVVGLAVICALLGLRSGADTAAAPAGSGVAVEWILSARAFVTGTAGMALIMMLCGILAAVAVGVVARVFDMVSNAGKRGASPRGAKGRRGKTQTA